MSADNWAVCPRCKREAEAKREAALKKLAADYGKVPADQYVQRRAELDKPLEHAQTLREDYGIGVDDEGWFTISYSCGCQKCGFVYEHKDEVKVLPDK